MSANRITITLASASSKSEKSKTTFKTGVVLHPDHVDEAVERFGEYLHHLAQDKKKLRILLESIAQASYDDYKEWYNKFHGL